MNSIAAFISMYFTVLEGTLCSTFIEFSTPTYILESKEIQETGRKELPMSQLIDSYPNPILTLTLYFSKVLTPLLILVLALVLVVVDVKCTMYVSKDKKYY